MIKKTTIEEYEPDVIHDFAFENSLYISLLI